MDTLEMLARYCGYISGILTLLILLVKPFREWLLGIKTMENGIKCLLRRDMLSTYYRHQTSKEIRQYEFENFEAEFQAYRALHGNGFMKKIYAEVQTWKVTT